MNETGVDSAAPKQIMKAMRVEGLTRENVASHLQKYRAYLKHRLEARPGAEKSKMAVVDDSARSNSDDECEVPDAGAATAAAAPAAPSARTKPSTPRKGKVQQQQQQQQQQQRKDEDEDAPPPPAPTKSGPSNNSQGAAHAA